MSKKTSPVYYTTITLKKETMRIKQKFHSPSSNAGEEKKKKKKKKKKGTRQMVLRLFTKNIAPRSLNFMGGPACPVTKVKRPRYLDRAKVA